MLLGLVFSAPMVNVCAAFRRQTISIEPKLSTAADLPETMLKKCDRLADLNADYDVIFCDVWGVLHNGVEARPFACEALSAFRRQGGSVVLITNSPRRREGVSEQLGMIGVDAEAFDRIVTSGDVTRDLIAAGPNAVYFIGPDRDRGLFEGLGVEEVGLDDAGVVVCTGLFDDEHETPEQYLSVLEDFRKRDLSFICANPDLVVERGERLIPCAGSIAALYKEMGGTTLVSGKPHSPIYQAALAQATQLRGTVGKDRILAVGDGMPTDVKGAQDFGLDLLYVSDGIHTREYTDGATVDEQRLEDFLDLHGARPSCWMQRLR
jgi:HAD superfamily hydrolase (TIGR01450 family)